MPIAYASSPDARRWGCPAPRARGCAGGCVARSTAMSFSRLLPTTSALDWRPVGERQLDLGGVGDDVQAGEDVAVDVDHDAAAEAAVRRPASRPCRAASVSISTSDGWTSLVDELGVGRRGRDRCERVGDGVVERRAASAAAVRERARRRGTPRRARRGLRARTASPCPGAPGVGPTVAADSFREQEAPQPSLQPCGRAGSRIRHSPAALTGLDRCRRMATVPAVYRQSACRPLHRIRGRSGISSLRSPTFLAVWSPRARPDLSSPGGRSAGRRGTYAYGRPKRRRTRSRPWNGLSQPDGRSAEVNGGSLPIRRPLTPNRRPRTPIRPRRTRTRPLPLPIRPRPWRSRTPSATSIASDHDQASGRSRARRQDRPDGGGRTSL